MIDTLLQKIDELENPSVVGLDPNIGMIPQKLKDEKIEEFGKTPKAVAEMFLEFNKGIIDAVADIVPAVKPQIAMYEQYALDGIDAYLKTIEYAKDKGLVLIGDIKLQLPKRMQHIFTELKYVASDAICGKRIL